MEKEFSVNEYITLKLENNETNIYVDGELFQQCKYLAITIPMDEVQEYDSITSIDDMEQGDRSEKYEELEISPEQEFWGHYSNPQVWAEHNYDTRLLHRTIAFPLLKKLVDIGDPMAEKVFKEEIISRFEEGNENVITFLMEQEYLDLFSEFSEEEIDTLLHSLNTPLGEVVLIAFKNNAPSPFYEYFDKLLENIELAKLGVENKAPHPFYIYFDKLLKNTELAKVSFKKYYSRFIHPQSESNYKDNWNKVQAKLDKLK